MAQPRDKGVAADADDEESVGLISGKATTHSYEYESVMRSVCSYIIVSEFCERLAFYGFQASLVLFFTRELGLTTANADVQASLWNGVCYLTCLFGGLLADSVTGRYQGIFIFISIYFVGMCGVTLAAQDFMKSAPLLFCSLYVVALGTGGIKPNVSTFGADQFAEGRSKEDPEKAKASFFNWFYLSINAGALISFTVVADLCQNYSFAVGYSIPTVAMAFAIFVFWLGSDRYIKHPAGGSVLAQFSGVLCQAFKGGCRRRRPNEQRPANVKTWLDYAKIENGGSFEAEKVEEVEDVVRLVPFLLLFIFYWFIYSQMSTTFFNQGCQMNLHLGSYQLPIAVLNLFDTLVIIALIPFVDKILYPFLRLSSLAKIGLGFVFAAAAMTVAAIVETWRLDAFRAGLLLKEPSICSPADDPGKALQVVDISVLWQVPQFMLIGLSEIFASITAMEFFYTEAPDSMKSVCSSLNLVTTAFGMWLTAILIPMVNADEASAWLPHDLNTGHLDRFFMLLAAIMMVDIVILYVASKVYTYRSERIARKQDQLEGQHSAEAQQP